MPTERRRSTNRSMSASQASDLTGEMLLTFFTSNLFLPSLPTASAEGPPFFLMTGPAVVGASAMSTSAMFGQMGDDAVEMVAGGRSDRIWPSQECGMSREAKV